MNNQETVTLPHVRYSSRLTWEVIQNLGICVNQHRTGWVLLDSWLYVLGIDGTYAKDVGHGDLNVNDIRRLEKELLEGEAIFILPFNVYSLKPYGTTNPTIDQIMNDVDEVIVHGQMFSVIWYNKGNLLKRGFILDINNHPGNGSGGYLPSTVIERDDVKAIIGISLT
jgi:hypothetical protein